MTYLTSAQRRKLPRNLQRSIESYNKSMSRASAAMGKMMDGGLTSDYVQGKFRVRKLMAGGKCYSCGGRMANGGQLYKDYADYSGSHPNMMSTSMGYNENAANYVNSPAHAIMRGNYNYGGYVGNNGPGVFNSPQSFSLGGNYNSGFGMNSNWEPNYRFQEGGMAGDSSDMYAAQLAQGQMADPAAMQQQQMPEQQGGEQEQQLMQLAQLIAQGDQEAIQLLKQLPPEIQQQVMAMVEQMQGGQQQMANAPQMQKGGKVKRLSEKSLHNADDLYNKYANMYHGYFDRENYADSTYDAISNKVDRVLDLSRSSSMGLTTRFGKDNMSYDDALYNGYVNHRKGVRQAGSSMPLGLMDAGYDYMIYKDPQRVLQATMYNSGSNWMANKAARLMALDKLKMSGTISQEDYNHYVSQLNGNRADLLPRKKKGK